MLVSASGVASAVRMGQDVVAKIQRTPSFIAATRVEASESLKKSRDMWVETQRRTIELVDYLVRVVTLQEARTAYDAFKSRLVSWKTNLARFRSDPLSVLFPPPPPLSKRVAVNPKIQDAPNPVLIAVSGIVWGVQKSVFLVQAMIAGSIGLKRRIDAKLVSLNEKETKKTQISSVQREIREMIITPPASVAPISSSSAADDDIIVSGESETTPSLESISFATTDESSASHSIG